MGGLDKNYYELLGLKRDASIEEVKRAYRDMSRIFHPDSNFYADLVQDPVKTEHLQIFNLITEAYNTLSSDELRIRYDQTLLNGSLVGWGDERGEYYADTVAPHARQFTQAAPQRAHSSAATQGAGFGQMGAKPQGQDSEADSDLHAVSESFKGRGIISKFRRLFGR